MNQNNELAITGGKPILSNSNLGKFEWPIINQPIKRLILNQADKTISIYNRSDIFEEFENAFAKYHKSKHALLFNSGTAAIHAMFVAAQLGPSDEIICPAYTFFATTSPIFFTGAKPVLVDCDKNGNIDPAEVTRAITKKTKAIIVTHMWGVPADIKKLRQIADKYHLLLLEDCSHAHGATAYGKIVGSWGDMAAWSLQGQKIVTGGEGGVLVTNNDELYYRALLFGHYNKRCKQEIPTNHPLYKFSITGMGLKLRAHPLAIVIAYEYLKRLDRWLKNKREFAKKIITASSSYPYLQVPTFKQKQPSWYAFVWQYDQTKNLNIPVEIYHDALQKENLSEFDLPRSTCPLNNLPLFQNPHQLFPNFYKSKKYYSEGQFPKAEVFYKQAIKMPIWVNNSDKKTINKYISGLNKLDQNRKILLQLSIKK